MNLTLASRFVFLFSVPILKVTAPMLMQFCQYPPPARPVPSDTPKEDLQKLTKRKKNNKIFHKLER